MKRLLVLVALVLLVAVGSYAVFAQQQQPPAAQPPMGRMGGGMGRGMMQGGMGCPGCAACGAMMQQSVAATSDGGVVVAVAGKVIKYDTALKKVSETNVDIDWTAVHEKMQQMMQSCPMMQQMMKQPPAPPAGQTTP